MKTQVKMMVKEIKVSAGNTKNTAATETKRLGRIFISTGMFYHHADNIAETLAKVRFLPVRVEHRVDIDAFEMAGTSNHFDPIVYGSVVPIYEIRIRNTDDGKEYAEVVRKTDEENIQ